MIKVKRIYDPPSKQDGFRVLVDRLWPRGLSKEAAAIDHWVKDIAPSDELRKWFGHDPEKWDEFCTRYRKELDPDSESVRFLHEKSAQGPLTLLFAAKDADHNNAVVLQDFLLHLHKH
ncbi:MAG: hypothetical protein AMXMBFR75_11190 [Candidatus Hinthialibacteria bacterium]